MDDADRTLHRARAERRLAASAPRWVRAIVDEVLTCPVGAVLLDLIA